jgi:hypothetical protein
MKQFAVALLIALPLGAVACGDDEDAATNTGDVAATTEDSATTTFEAESEDGQKPGGFGLVEACGEQTGQDIFAAPPATPEFIACLEQLGAPPDTIDAWRP